MFSFSSWLVSFYLNKDGATLQRNLRQLLALVILNWATHVFLPAWTTTPALYFFLNALATMLVEWSVRPVPGLVAPWCTAACAILAQAVYSSAACVLGAQSVVVLLWVGVARLSPWAIFTLYATAAAIMHGILVNEGECELKPPFA